MERKSFFDVDDCVDAETAQAFVQPPVDIFVDFLADLRVLPVQVGLLLVEYVQILLVGSRKILPHRAAEVGAPVGGKLAFFFIS